jgi:hypothetical protein
MSEATSARDEYDDVPTAVVFQRDPGRTRRKRRIGMTVGAVVVSLFYAMGISTPEARLVFFVFATPFAILVAVLAKLWWNADPPKLVVDSAGMTYKAELVPWNRIRTIKLEIHELREGGTAASFIVKDIQDHQVIWFFAHAVGAYVPDIVDAIALFAPTQVLDPSLQRYRNGPDEK